MIGKSRGFCHVDFKDAESMEKAITELEGIEIVGRTLRVDRAQVKTAGSFDRSSTGYGSSSRSFDRGPSYGSARENTFSSNNKRTQDSNSNSHNNW